MLKGLYFVLISILAASLFYVFFGTVFDYRQPFFLIPLFPVFLGAHTVLSVVVFAFSLRGDTKKLRESMASKSRRTVSILVSALILSALFPAGAAFGLYPVQMAMFHLLILFYAGISFGALSLAGTLFMMKSGIRLSLLDKYVFTLAVVISLCIPYMAVRMFTSLPVG